MRRRDFLALAAAGAMAGSTRAAPAQQSGRTYRLGFTAPSSPDAPQWQAVVDEPRGAGFAEGGNLVVDRSGLGRARGRSTPPSPS